VATSSGGDAAILWVVYAAREDGEWLVTGTMKPVNEVRLVEDWSVLQTEHFRLHYTASEATALRILDGLVQQYARLSKIFGVDLEVVDVYLVEDGQKWLSILGEGVPPRAAGLAGRNIALLATRSTDPNRLNQTAAHELVHMFVAKRVGDRTVPLWLNEGLAVYLATSR